MKAVALDFKLPSPWVDARFATSRVGFVNYLVGPNGSGKSRFAEALRAALPGRRRRLLSTDRLRGLEKEPGLGIWGDGLDRGLVKEYFSRFEKDSAELGFGIDTFVLLERRLDLRIRVEATLSHIFNRGIILEWDSGILIPKATLGPAGDAYKIAGEECHGIKELIVLLTHIYNDDTEFLIIDEPEQNLHPQFQAYFMEEVRKVAGDPAEGSGKKIVFLITHSPFILQLRNTTDLQSIVTFDLRHSAPRHLYGEDAAFGERLQSLVLRLNVHYKQLFFSDNPVFVEGVLDAQILSAIQEARGASFFAAGSCLIDAGGKDELAKYVELCLLLGKTAHFVFDLDSLFRGLLRQCIRGDTVIDGFLAKMGLGATFAEYVGLLEQKLTNLYEAVRSMPKSEDIAPLFDFLINLEVDGKLRSDAWPKTRVALLVHLHLNRTSLVTITCETLVAEIEGRVSKIIEALRERNIHLLTLGELENCLPSYTGSPYEIPDNKKAKIVQEETSYLSQCPSEDEMRARYRGLYTIVEMLPTKPKVDFEMALKSYVGRYIFELQRIALANPEFDKAAVETALKRVQPSSERLFGLESFARTSPREFSGQILVRGQYGEKDLVVEISHTTNAALLDFHLKKAPNVQA